MQELLRKISFNQDALVNMGSDLNSWAEQLFNEQRRSWPLLKENLEGLEKVNLKEIGFGHFWPDEFAKNKASDQEADWVFLQWMWKFNHSIL